MPSAWITHVKQVYAKNKKKNPNYKYGQAMKDAKASYKKGRAAAAEPVEAPKKRRRKKKAEEGGVNEEEKVEPVKKKRIRKRTLLS